MPPAGRAATAPMSPGRRRPGPNRALQECRDGGRRFCRWPRRRRPRIGFILQKWVYPDAAAATGWQASAVAPRRAADRPLWEAASDDLFNSRATRSGMPEVRSDAGATDWPQTHGFSLGINRGIAPCGTSGRKRTLHRRIQHTAISRIWRAWLTADQGSETLSFVHSLRARPRQRVNALDELPHTVPTVVRSVARWHTIAGLSEFFTSISPETARTDRAR
jgi:hypothetical protein